MIDLKLFRKDNGIRQKEICAVLGVKQAYISLIECGERPLNKEKFEILKKHYGSLVDPYHEIYKQKNRQTLAEKEPEEQAHNLSSDDRSILLNFLSEKDRVIELLNEKYHTLHEKYEAEVEKRVLMEEKLNALLSEKITVKKLESLDGPATSN